MTHPIKTDASRGDGEGETIELTRDQLIYLVQIANLGTVSDKGKWANGLLMAKLGRCEKAYKDRPCQSWSGHPGRHLHQSTSIFISWDPA